MIDLEKAVKILQREYQGQYPNSCKETNDFWIFTMSPGYMPEGEICYTGTIFPIVYKESGKIEEYDITEHPSEFRFAKRVF